MKSPLPLDPAYLVAHENPVRTTLRQWKENSRVAPVQLLTGPKGIGKREIAYWIAQTLLCERAGFTKPAEEPLGLFGGSEPAGLGLDLGPSEVGPCRSCPACERAESGNFLDFKEITTEKDSSVLKIDQFREIKESQGYAGFSGSYRIFCIPEAERMNVQAANSILKLLEEPPAGWVFLLTASDPSLLPSTVISRCQLMRLRPLPLPTVEKLLRAQEVPENRLATCVALSQGSVTRALELASDEAWEKRGLIFQFLQQPHSQLSALVDWAAQSDENLSLLLDQFEQILIDLIRALQTPGHVYANLDGEGVIAKHLAAVQKKLGSKERALAFWMGRSERIFKLRREMNTPMNVKLLIQDLLIPWLEAT